MLIRTVCAVTVDAGRTLYSGQDSEVTKKLGELLIGKKLAVEVPQVKVVDQAAADVSEGDQAPGDE